MSIGKRLMLVMIVIIAASAGSSMVGIFSLYRARDSAALIYHRATEPIALANQLTESFLSMHLHLFQLSSTDDTMSIPTIEEKIRTEQTTVGELEKKLSGIASEQIDPALFEEINLSLDEYVFVSGSIMEMVDAGNMSAAEMKVKFELTLLGDAINETINLVAENLVKYAADLNTRIDSAADSNASFVIILSILVAAGSLVVSLLLARAISSSLLKTAQLSQTIAAGDLTVSIDPALLNRKDEIGQLSNAMAGMVHTLRDSMGSVSSAETQVRETAHQLDRKVENEVEEVRRISRNVDEVNQLVINQSASVTETAATVNEIVANLQRLNNLIEDQSANVTESSASVEQMIGNNKSVADNVGNMSQAFVALETASATGKERINQTVAIIQRVAEQSVKLQEANTVINAIAAQTNLLAMNAAIEAAHAGNAGRGFAVVADEIRTLAYKAASQSREISQDIKSIREFFKQATESSTHSEAAFKDILAQIAILGRYEHEIKSAMEEQINGSRQILEATTQINDITIRVRDSSSEMLGGSQAIVAEMDGLHQASQSVSQRMHEITNGTESIQSSIAEIRSISQKAASLALELSDQVARFKL